jgi:tryptophan synthase alpha chain
VEKIVSRLAALFAQFKTQQRRALVPYIVAGDPNPGITVNVMHALVEAGADILELGVPFSDPMAEGPTIQLAHERALVHHVSLTKVLAMVSEFRQKDSATPVVLMGYANPVERMGYAAFADNAIKAGVDGLLTVDMPPEEADDLNTELKRVGIDNIFLLAPTTTDARIRKIADLASGYLYCVSLKGVTGAGNLDLPAVEAQVNRIKAISNLPLTVGFGIKDAESAKAIGRYTEGVVVGSALVQRIADNGGDATTATNLMRELRAALDSLN